MLGNIHSDLFLQQQNRPPEMGFEYGMFQRQQGSPDEQAYRSIYLQDTKGQGVLLKKDLSEGVLPKGSRSKGVLSIFIKTIRKNTI